MSPPLLFPLFLLRNWVTLNSGCCCEYRTYRGLSDLGPDRSSGSVFVTPFLSQESGAVDERAVGRCSAASLVIPLCPTDRHFSCSLQPPFCRLGRSRLECRGKCRERERERRGPFFPMSFLPLASPTSMTFSFSSAPQSFLQFRPSVPSVSGFFPSLLS